MITGEHPCGEMGPAELSAAKLHDEPRSVLGVRPDADPSLAATVDRCLARLAEQRPRAVEVVAELARGSAVVTVPASEEGPLESVQLWAEILARRVPVMVGFFFLGSWGSLFGANALVEAGLAGPSAYALLLVFLASGFHAVLIRAWFHGTGATSDARAGAVDAGGGGAGLGGCELAGADQLRGDLFQTTPTPRTATSPAPATAPDSKTPRAER